MINEQIAERLKNARIENNYTQKQIAQILGISTVTYTNYENNKRTFPNDVIVKLSKLFNISIEYIYNGGIFTKLGSLDQKKIKQSINASKSRDNFFKSLGYNVEMLSNEDGDSCVIINDVKYSDFQFNMLLNMISTCIDNVQELLRDSNKLDEV